MNTKGKHGRVYRYNSIYLKSSLSFIVDEHYNLNKVEDQKLENTIARTNIRGLLVRYPIYDYFCALRHTIRGIFS